jgi:predicted ATPase/DNA-binding XRE family transcriptional regulator
MTASRAPAFGDLLKRHRIAAGVTQEHLADVARISTNAISSLERGIRRAPHRDTVALLATALRLSEGERRNFEEAAAIMRGRGGGDASASSRTAVNLPAFLTSFVGREYEIAQLVELLAQQRLLTITGSGGIGKTRVSLEVAKRVMDRFPDGVCFVDLAPLGDGGFLTSTIASLLEIGAARSGSIEALVAALRMRRLLLIFDNCEHVNDAAAKAAGAILRDSPSVTILATSRQPLQVSGETLYRLPSLALPPKTISSVAEGRAYSAIDLFVQRAAAAEQHFEFNDESAGPVAEICKRLDGIALAIELAAAHLSTFGLRELQARIAQHFDVLSAKQRDVPARHQTLTAALEWSYALLDERERALLRRLAIFSRGCRLEAAERVGAIEGEPPGAAVDALTSLIDKSLVVTEVDGETTRYRLLEATRAFAAAKLDESGERERVARRHAQWVAEFADRVDKTYQIAPRQHWMAVVAPELDNARAALEWALGVGDDAVIAGRIAGGLSGMWRIAGLEAERRRWVLAALERIDEESHPAIAARLLRSLAGSLNGQARIDAAVRGLALCERIGDTHGAAGCHTGIAYGLLQIGEPQQALEAVDKTRAIFRGEGRQASPLYALMLIDRSAILRALGRLDEALAELRQAQSVAASFDDDTIAASVESALADVAFESGGIAEARRLAETALAAARRSGSSYREMSLLNMLAGIALALEDRDAARTFAHEALAAAHGREPHVVTIAIQHLAALAAAKGDAERAARLFGYVERGYRRETHALRETVARRSYGLLVKAIDAKLTPQRRAAALEQGANFDEEIAVREALQV